VKSASRRPSTSSILKKASLRAPAAQAHSTNVQLLLAGPRGKARAQKARNRCHGGISNLDSCSTRLLASQPDPIVRSCIDGTSFVAQGAVVAAGGYTAALVAGAAQVGSTAAFARSLLLYLLDDKIQHGLHAAKAPLHKVSALIHHASERRKRTIR